MNWSDFIEHGAHVGGWLANGTAFVALIYGALRCVLLLQKILRSRRERR